MNLFPATQQDADFCEVEMNRPQGIARMDAGYSRALLLLAQKDACSTHVYAASDGPHRSH